MTLDPTTNDAANPLTPSDAVAFTPNENHGEDAISSAPAEEIVAADEVEAASEATAADEQIERPVEPVSVDAVEQSSVKGVMGVVEALLKSPVELLSKPRTTVPLLAVLVTCHLVYGLICGSFSGEGQWIAAPLKILFGAFAAGLLCLPSLYIFACLSGAKISVGDACKLMWSALALTSLLLLGFAPVAFIFTFSVQSLAFMGCIHLGVWLVSIGFGIRFVLRGVEAKEGAAGNGIMAVWSAVLILTTLQMTTTLRPILGTSDRLFSTEKKFFLVHWSDSITKEAEAIENEADETLVQQNESKVEAELAAH